MSACGSGYKIDVCLNFGYKSFSLEIWMDMSYTWTDMTLIWTDMSYTWTDMTLIWMVSLMGGLNSVQLIFLYKWLKLICIATVRADSTTSFWGMYSCNCSSMATISYHHHCHRCIVIHHYHQRTLYSSNPFRIHVGSVIRYDIYHRLMIWYIEWILYDSIDVISTREWFLRQETLVCIWLSLITAIFGVSDEK